jgi:hypothetical protein
MRFSILAILLCLLFHIILYIYIYVTIFLFTIQSLLYILYFTILYQQIVSFLFLNYQNKKIQKKRIPITLMKLDYLLTSPSPLIKTFFLC